MTDLPPFDEADLFDEAGYLRLYPGVAHAMMAGTVDAAWNHYFHHGRHEGRRPNDVDPYFYLAAYPEMEHDLGRKPAAADAAPHYITLGRARGYLPNASAPRSWNGAAMPSPFGGLWTDQANALDLVQNRLDLGWLRRREAEMVRSFALDGIVELSRPNDMDRVQAVALMVAQSFTGRFPAMLFDGPEPLAEPEPWRPELTERHTGARDPHMFSRAVRELLLDKSVTDILTLLFDAPPRLTASRAYLREAATPDRDVAWHGYSLPLRFVAVTFALEDEPEGPEHGRAQIWRGSHRLPDLPWCGAHVTLAEARRLRTLGLDEALAMREATVRRLVHGQEPRRPRAIAGARTFRHANLIHAIDPPEPPLQCRSLTAWYCPSHVVPCYLETGRRREHSHGEFVFTSGDYPALDPID